MVNSRATRRNSRPRWFNSPAEAKPPLRFVAGAVAVEAADAKLGAMRAEFDLWRPLALGTDYGK